MEGLIASGVWVQGLYGILLFFGAVAMYLSRNRGNGASPARESQTHNSIVAGVGLGWVSSEQTERLLHHIEVIAIAAKSIAKNQETDIEDKIDSLKKQLERTERANEARERALIARDR